MPYFDSPKNRAMWNKELEGLRAEREERKKGGFAAYKKSQTPSEHVFNPHRTPMTYHDLVREVEQEASAKRARRPFVPSETAERKKKLSAQIEIKSSERVL